MKAKSTRSSSRQLVAASHVRAQSRSGLNIKAYCRKVGIGASTFYYWCKRERERSAAKIPVPSSPSFVEVFPSPRSSARYRIEFRNGRVLEFPSGFQRDEVRLLLDAVEGQTAC